MHTKTSMDTACVMKVSMDPHASQRSKWGTMMDHVTLFV